MSRARRASLLGVLTIVAACTGPTAVAPSGGSGPSLPASPKPSRPVFAATPAPTQAGPMPTPVAGMLGELPVTTLSLGDDAAPIDIIFAFDSIWIANHHSSNVMRLDPTTMAVQATIPIGGGPGWFAATEDSLWVSRQMTRGVARIDPATNTAEGRAGDYAACGRPAYAFGSVWQPACDAHQVIRVDPVTYEAVNVPLGNGNSVVFTGTELIAGGSTGLFSIDPSSGTSTPIGGPAGWAIGYADGTVWVAGDSSLYRVRPSDGKVLATLPIGGAGMLVTSGDRAWIGREAPDLVEVDLTTNAVVRTISVQPWPASAVEVDGSLWITNFERSSVIRLDL